MYSFCCKSLEKIQINFSSIKLLENKNCCDANGVWYCLLQNGTLKIIDRKKHIFKLSQGEYIVPEKIENIYLRSQYVHQVFLHGESLKSCVVGIVIPDVDVVKCWAVENGIPGTLSVLCANPQVKQLIMDDMLAWGKEAGLKSFEQVNEIILQVFIHLTNFR